MTALKTLLPALALIAAALPAAAQEDEVITFAPMVGASLTERIWVRTDRPDLPGSMQLFLSDGVMLMDSCWETYRLSNWRMHSETELSWDEDGMTITAEIVQLDEAELVLALDLGEEIVTQYFAVAPVPYVCPDMMR